MPTATSFTALGRGNGFPFCVINSTDSDSSGSVLSFSNPSRFKYGSTVSEGYVNAVEYTPVKRVCNEALELPIPRNTFPPYASSDGGWFVAQADESVHGDDSAQFAIRSIYYATDTSKYYIGYTSSLRADDGSFKEEMPFSGLNFDYYTY
jgi:hypothetical protein